MNIVVWILFGALAGWLAGLIMGNQQGLLGNILVGILGSALGGFLASLLGFDIKTGFSVAGLLVAVAGACLLLWIYNLIRRNGKK